MKKSDTLLSLNPSVMIPIDINYTFRCVEESVEKSNNSGSLMVVRELELIAPETIEFNNNRYGMAGMKLYQYITFKVSDGKGGFDKTKTQLAMGRVWTDYEKLGFTGEDIDENNPILIAKGRKLLFKMKNEEFTYTAPLTQDDIQAGKKFGQGAPVIDEATGKPKIGFKHVLGYLQGVAA